MGQAAKWATAILLTDSDTAYSYPQLWITFQYPDSKVEVDSYLFHLRQGDWPVSRYMAAFRMLAVLTMWSYAVLHNVFYEELASRLKDELVG